MSQYNAGKNPPWARTATAVAQAGQITAPLINQATLGPAGLSSAPAVVLSQQTSPHVTYNHAIGVHQGGPTLQQGPMLAQVQPAVAMPTSLGAPGVALPTSLATSVAQVNTVSYPAPRALHSPSYSQTQMNVSQVNSQQTSTQSTPKRFFSGCVTKLTDNFGLVNDVFFPTSCVKGVMPKLGDRVLVEASYNVNMPIKWTATRIQVLPISGSNNNSMVCVPSVSQMPQSNTGGFSTENFNTMQSPEPASNFRVPSIPPARRLSPSRRDRERDHEYDHHRDRDRDREKRDDRSKEKLCESRSPRKRSRSPIHSRSPPRRRQRAVPRYMVQIPKISLDMCKINVMELRRRYTNLYVPSDFFMSYIKWPSCFPSHRKLLLSNPCAFYVMHKDVDQLNSCDSSPNSNDPSDADHLFSAKVMLLSTPSLEELYSKTCAPTSAGDDIKDNLVHPTRLIQFLVGLKGKNETMAIGGPWSPSLDGKNPESDPSVLIRTAIRTCKDLTGIDLSSCTRWYRFLEIYYQRGESIHKGQVVPPRAETVVMFLPDVRSCVPTQREWEAKKLQYQDQVAARVKPEEPAPIQEDVEMEDPNNKSNRPSHYKDIDPKTLKIVDLRQELEARHMKCSGLRSQLIARLEKALKLEAEKETAKLEAAVSQQIANEKSSHYLLEADRKREDEEKKKKLEEKEKLLRDKIYSLPEDPHVIVHPSRTAKSGKFDCTVMSLSVLLDYRQEDNKEHSFEVSLFAEQFNEMLLRDFGLNIYKALCGFPRKTKDEDKNKSVKRKGKNLKDKTGKEENLEEKEEELDKESSNNNFNKKDSKKKSRNKIKPVHYVAYPELLLSFVYFDQTQCGYILDKDIEEIIFTLGLNLSRAQVRKLVQKFVTRDTFHYRSLTDSVKSSQVPELDSSDTSVNWNELELNTGNISLLPVFCDKDNADESASQPASEGSSHNGFISYRGSMVDINELQLQLMRSEEARRRTEADVKSLQIKIDFAESEMEKRGDTIKKLIQKLDDKECKLKFAERETQKYSESYEKCVEGVSQIKQVTSTLVELVAGMEQLSHNTS